MTARVAAGDAGDPAEPGAGIGMDFALEPDQRELVALAERIYADLATTDAVAAVERSGERVDWRLWRALAETGLLGLAIDERWGGAASGPGSGAVELALLLQHQARHVAPVPLWPTLLLGAYPIQRCGDEALQRRWLPGVAAGEVVLTGAYGGIDVARRITPVAAHRERGRTYLSGYVPAVPAAHVARRVLVPALDGGQWWLYLVDPAVAGVGRERAITTDRSIQAHLSLDGVPVEERIPVSPGQLRDVLDHARVGLCAQQLGVADRALSLTAGHVASRYQFGRAIGSFQAVAHRAADSYVEAEALRCLTLRAAWLLGHGRPATAETAAAAWWAVRAGHRVTHAALHLHGGTGNDVEYPLHRYFLWARQIGLMLGGGRTLADVARLVPELD